MKRFFDFAMSVFLLILASVPMVLIGLAIRLTSKGPALYWSDRVGVNNTIFRMPKFRTMKMDTPVVATHLLTSPDQHVTPLGRVLRRYSLDELPQLISVALGDMSMVGPRPALYNQYDLIELRTAKSVHRLLPGITGWAQINGRDELPIPEKVQLDAHYLKHQSMATDLQIMLLTFFSVLSSKGVTH
jgi:O-antigen biosynthesis protein WbqP